MSTTDNAPPLHPKISRKQLAKMSPREQAEHAQRVAIQAIKRYGGNPELLLKEHPELDFRNPPPPKFIKP
jgi:hypothetical protein